MDGTNDYTNYTEQELLEAMGSINRDRYPKNYARLQSALAKFNQLGLKRPWEKTDVALEKNQDGQIDYQDYNLQELNQGLAAIDQAKYPLNYQNLTAEHQRKTALQREADRLAIPPVEQTIQKPKREVRSRMTLPQRVASFVSSVAVLAYGIYCLFVGRVFIPGEDPTDSGSVAMGAVALSVFFSLLAIVVTIFDYRSRRKDKKTYILWASTADLLAFLLIFAAVKMQLSHTVGTG